MTLKHNHLLGLILIAVGAFAILGNSGLFGGMGNMIFAIGIGTGGLYLLRQFMRNRQQLWASIAGSVLAGLALASMTGAMAGFYFLAMIGLGFIIIYHKQPEHWWAIIPGGALWTLATVAASEVLLPRWDASALFFAGLAATFGYLYKLGRGWSIYPAIVLFMVAFLNFSFSGGWIVPALLIAAGFYIIQRKRHQGLNSGQSTDTLEKPIKDILIEKLSSSDSDSKVADQQLKNPEHP